MTAPSSSTFQLFDLRVETVAPTGDRPMLCSSKPGDYFELKGEVLSMPGDQGFSIYSLAAVLPLLPAKQRATSQGDWMNRIACPDPMCGSTLLVRRTAVSTWSQDMSGIITLIDQKKL
ncbi:MAG: hypothetical protein TREMPRED_003448 [Tremellales sp. Tagirdzhanova-0007]|nr:MAG: hypothetical protein TREMPRED_003448 [Tremellales sp. Tagirdzhanova-0007]